MGAGTFSITGIAGNIRPVSYTHLYIKQMISKGFALYLYDYKFDDLSVIAYNELLKNIDKVRRSVFPYGNQSWFQN